MPFFSNDTATIVQLISFPLEVIGFSMIIIEVYYSGTAKRMKKWLKKFPKSVSKRIRAKMNATEELRLSIGLFIGLPIALVMSFVIPFVYFSELLNYLEFHFAIEFVIMSVLGLLVFIPLYFIVFSAIKLVGVIVRSFFLPLDIIRLIILFFDKLTAGKALSGFGLTLAFFGVLGEMYQVLTILLA